MHAHPRIFLYLLAALTLSPAVLADLVGQPAPPVHIDQWIKNGPVNLFDGKSIFVFEFWETACGPCHAVIPRLTELQHLYQGRVYIVAISDEPASIVSSFVASQGSAMDYTVAVDTTRQTFSNYGVDWIAQSFIVGPEGRVMWQGHTAELSDPLAQAVAALLRVVREPNGGWIEEGDPFTFTIEIAGAVGNPSYIWCKDGVTVGENAPEYHIEHATPDEAGLYSCIITDEGQRKTQITSTPVRLEVFAPGSLPAVQWPALALLILAFPLIAALSTTGSKT